MKKENTKLVILLSLLFISIPFSYAVPAIPDPVLMTQPDGTTLTVMIRGDERVNWYESMDGYTLLFNTAGYLSYAQLDENGNLQPTDRIATDIDKRNIVTASFLKTINKKLFYSKVQCQLMLKVWEIEDNLPRGERALEGQYKTLCAFVQFPEKAMVKQMSEFEGMMNQLGYTGNGSGSVRDFFKESSYGKFDLTITLCGVYTTTQSESYYAGSSGTDNCSALARWTAQQVAAEADINFTEYDSNNDDKVDWFHFIFAGRGQEAGGGAGTIWSHKSQFSPSVTKNGKSINEYSCSPELYLSSITTIGVICHEMTHGFGAPDFYDVDYGTGGEYTGTGNWDLMASGSWNSSGNKPAHHNMYTKVQFGWVTPEVLSTPKTVLNMPNAAENPVAYRINTATNNEYYLLENRQRVKFDAGLPGDGLIIYHVHSNVNGGYNGVNATHPQRMYPVCASRTTQMPNSTPSSYGNINSLGCPFPGTSNKKVFDDNSTPAMKSWANANTNKPITNIIHIDRLISFDFMGGGTVASYTITATCGENGKISPEGVTTLYEGFSQSYTITPNNHYEIASVLINGVNNPDAVASGKYTFSEISANHTIHATFAPKTYTVTFNANGGTGEMEPQVFTYGVDQALELNTFTKPDATFDRWNTFAGGLGTNYANGQIITLSTNIKLFAQWDGNSGIEEVNPYSSIQVIPNPAHDYVELRIENYELGIHLIEFYNMFGQVVKSVPVNGNIQENMMTQRISITDLSKGVYLVKIGSETAKLVVQ